MNKTPVSILQEMMAKQNMIPDYELIQDDGGRHVNMFTYRVTCNNLSATGTGRCKKDAKHQAAKAMLTEVAVKAMLTEVAANRISQLPAANTPTVSPSKSPLHTVPLPKNVTFVNAVGELQELCVENNLQGPEYTGPCKYIKNIGASHAKTFSIRCKIFHFEEVGVAPTKKQAKHDAAKKMMNKMRSFINNLKDFCEEKNIEDSSNSSIDTETMNKNVEECFRTLKLRKINIGRKLEEYSNHSFSRDSLEINKRIKILRKLERTFPNETTNNGDITKDIIMKKMSQLKAILSEINVTINVNDVSSDKRIRSIQLNTCPPLTQLGVGRNKLEASWDALSQTINSVKLLFS